MEENIFGQSEQEVATYGKGNGKCPPGHKKSMDAGGNGHYPGDKCGCGDGVGTTVPIGIIIYPLIITAFIIIILTRFKPKH